MQGYLQNTNFRPKRNNREWDPYDWGISDKPPKEPYIRIRTLVIPLRYGFPVPKKDLIPYVTSDITPVTFRYDDRNGFVEVFSPNDVNPSVETYIVKPLDAEMISNTAKKVSVEEAREYLHTHPKIYNWRANCPAATSVTSYVFDVNSERMAHLQAAQFEKHIPLEKVTIADLYEN